MNQKLLDLIRKKFMDRLQAKTGWGRIDVLVEYDRAVSEAVIELLDELQQQPK